MLLPASNYAVFDIVNSPLLRCPGSTAAFGAQPVRVLIIDDSRSSLAFLGHVIGALEGIEIASCLLPSKALALAATTQFDLVLVDHVMPEMDGVEVTRRLRAQEAYRLVPI